MGRSATCRSSRRRGGARTGIRWFGRRRCELGFGRAAVGSEQLDCLNAECEKRRERGEAEGTGRSRRVMGESIISLQSRVSISRSLLFLPSPICPPPHFSVLSRPERRRDQRSV